MWNWMEDNMVLWSLNKLILKNSYNNSEQTIQKNSSVKHRKCQKICYGQQNRLGLLGVLKYTYLKYSLNFNLSLTTAPEGVKLT